MITVSIILPTYNEKENIPRIIERLSKVLNECGHEIVVVDDNSPDGTWKIARQLSREHENLRCIRRIDRKGLGSAVMEGFLLGRGEYLLVTDADMQHDLELIPEMLKAAKQHDVVIGSRYMAQKQVEDWTPWRERFSRWGTLLSRKATDYAVTDPLSGFFLIRRELVDEIAPRIEGYGFKVLLEILIRIPGLRVKELPYRFRMRKYGQSKIDPDTLLHFLDLLLLKTPVSWVKTRFIRYALIGSVGVGIHLFCVWFFYVKWNWAFPWTVLVAIQVSLLSNYTWNNLWTFQELRFKEWKWWTGWLRYNLACSIGSLYNIIISSYLVADGIGWVWASLFGISVGISWNYLGNRLFTWRTE